MSKLQRMSFRIAGALVVLATIAAVDGQASGILRSNRSVESTSDEGCSWIFLCPGGHIASGGDPAVRPTHGGCMTCSGGAPADCHDYCNVTLNATDSLTATRYRIALAAAKRDDIPALVALSLQIPQYVRVDVDRNDVQLLDCKADHVIESLPLEDRPR